MDSSWTLTQKQSDINLTNLAKNGLASRLHNEKTKIIQHNIIEITGLPSYLCDKQTLLSPEWFGHFGLIAKIFVDYKNSWAYIMYSSSKNTTEAIESMHLYKCPNPIKNKKKKHILHCTYAITKYCTSFLNNKPCHRLNCFKVHYKANINDVITPKLNKCEYKYLNKLDGQENEIGDLKLKLEKMHTINKQLKHKNNTLNSQVQQEQKQYMLCANKINEITKEYKLEISQLKNKINIITKEKCDIEIKAKCNQNMLSQNVLSPNVLSPNVYIELAQLREELQTQRVQYGILQSEYLRILGNVGNNNKNIKYTKIKGKYNKLQKKYNELKEKIGYKSWDWLDIYEWINTVKNNRFSIYNEELSINLKNENIDGIKLELMDEKELERIGIKQHYDRKVLLNEIKILTNNIEGYYLQNGNNYMEEHTYDIEGNCN